LALIAALSILTQGYLVGPINHGFQLALIRQFAGETAFRDDAFLQAMARTYTTFFFPALGMLAKAIPLSAVLFVLFVVFRALSVWLCYELALALFRDTKTALISAAISSVHLLTFAMDIVSENYLTHGAPAQVLSLAALLMLARGRIVWAFALAGLMFDVHGMHATHLIMAMGLAVISTRSGPDRRRALKALLIAAPVTIILASPAIVWMVKDGVLGAPIPDGYVEAVKSWFPTHFWPSTWSLPDWIAFFFPALAAWPLSRLAGPAEDGERIRRVIICSFLIALVGGLLTEIHPTPFLLRLHPLRLSFFVCLAGAPYFARASVELLGADRERFQDRARTAFVLGAFILVGAAIPLAYRWEYLLLFVPALFGVVLQRGAMGAWGSVALSIAIPIALVLQSEKMEIDAALRFMLVEAGFGIVASLSILRGWLKREQQASERERKLIARTAIALVAGHLLLNGLLIAHYGYKGGIKRWREVQEWCGSHLEPGERVLVPLTQIGLRAFSEQVPAVDFQEGDALFHQPSYLGTFLGKLRVYGWTPSELKGYEFISKLDALDDALAAADLDRIGQELDARVLIRRSRNPRLDLLVLFENEDFVVYALDGRSRNLRGADRQ
jgi:hypothetical protein